MFRGCCEFLGPRVKGVEARDEGELGGGAGSLSSGSVVVAR